MKNTRKKYSAEFKIYAVSISIQYRCVLRVANELQISRHSLQHWKKLFNDGKLTLKKPAGSATDRNELVRLQRENKDIRQERDILKKVPNIFTRRDGLYINLSEKMLVNFPL